MTVEVKLLNYTFHFRKLTWREESSLKIPKGKSQVRPVLAAALVNVSGLEVKSPEEAGRVVAALPQPVAERVYRIYKGLLPPNWKFETAGLYRAPEPSIYVKRVVAEDDVIDEASDRVMKKMEQDFGKEELREAAEIDRQIVKGSKLRGAVRLIPTDRGTFVAAPPEATHD
jgi:hypothetical protein